MKRRSTGPSCAKKVSEFRADLVVDVLLEVHEIHFVDGDDDVTDADQVRDERMPPRLRHETVTRVDENQRQIRRARAGDHVARVLFVARSVGDDELPAFGVRSSDRRRRW